LVTPVGGKLAEIIRSSGDFTVIIADTGGQLPETCINRTGDLIDMGMKSGAVKAVGETYVFDTENFRVRAGTQNGFHPIIGFESKAKMNQPAAGEGGAEKPVTEEAPPVPFAPTPDRKRRGAL
jgi:hypothetical protein